jgi:hypothetical protein
MIEVVLTSVLVLAVLAVAAVAARVGIRAFKGGA